jgi:septum formation inhibitor MinC
VLDSKGSVVYTSLNGNAFPGSAGNLYVHATGNGVTTVFSVPFVPSLIFINGVYQNQNTYTLSAGDVTFSEAPPFNAVIEFLV